MVSNELPNMIGREGRTSVRSSVGSPGARPHLAEPEGEARMVRPRRLSRRRSGACDASRSQGSRVGDALGKTSDASASETLNQAR